MLGLVASLHAADLPAPVTLDLPVPLNRALPAWLGQPDAPASNLAMLNLPILTPDTTASLLVTVYFQEKQGSYLRIFWKSTQSAQLLSDNFYEDIGMGNQRSLLIPATMLTGDGTLTFQCGDAKMCIQRIKLQWLETRDSLAAPQVQDLMVTSADGTTLPSASLDGQPAPCTPGVWHDELVTVPMTDSAVRIEQGVDFSVDLDKVPGAARIALEETGLPMGKRLVVWINETRAGTMAPAVPDLLDEGYLTDSKTVTSYIGWRPASFYAPVSLLKAGVNTVQFSTEDDASAPTAKIPASNSSDAPLAIKSLVVQLNYTPPPAAAAANFVPQFSLSPSGPSLRAVSTESTPP